MRWLLAIAVMLICCSCPPKDQPGSSGQPGQSGESPAPAEQPDEFELYANKLASEDGFYYELKRLQGLHTSPPGFSGISMGNADQRFDIAAVIEDSRAGFSLTDRDSGEQWTLWGWIHDGADPPPVSVIKDQPTSGGHHLELSFGGSGLMLKLLARWDHSRYLQVSREIMLGGLDLSHNLSPSFTDWSVDGPWLPYRMVPSYEGPYGVVRDLFANDDWHGSSHPGYAMVPAVAAYDRNHGVMLCATDEHARKCDRAYEAQYRVATDYSYGSMLRLRYGQYNGMQDVFDRPYIVSGLPQRDSIVLELFNVNSISADVKLVESETIEVISRVADIVHAYHFKPEPPEQLPIGTMLRLQEWDNSSDTDFIRNAVDEWDVIVVEGLSGMVHELGCHQPSTILAERYDSGLPDLYESNSWTNEGVTVILGEYLPLDVLMLDQDKPWFERDGAEAMFDHPLVKQVNSLNYTEKLINIRIPEYFGECIRNYDSLFSSLPEGTGIGNSPFPGVAAIEGQLSGQGQFYGSFDATNCLQVSRIAELADSDDRDVKISMTNGLKLLIPACSNLHLLNYPVTVSSEKQQSSPVMFIVSNRLTSYAAVAIFGVHSFVQSPDTTLAEQVVCSTWAISGHVLSKSQQLYYGFDAFAEYSTDLVKAARDMRVIMCDPPSSSYLSGGEMPAVVDKVVAMIPGQLEGSSQYWFAFYGTGGSVSVDEFNNLTVTWDGFGFWREKLPAGFWVVEHPDPANLIAGDAVLVRRKPLAPGPIPDADMG